jgi:phospholipase B1
MHPSPRFFVVVFLVLTVLAYAPGAAIALAKDVEDTPSAASVCPSFSRPAEPCTSVWNMQPSQVDVVLALGDSITAAFGAKGRRGGFHESRGLSWSIGGDEGATTLPNFIKQHNPNLTGYSLGSRETSLCWGPVCRDVHRQRHDHLNGALSGSTIRNVWLDQLDYLEDQMITMGINEESWKVLTLFVGANDLCICCKLPRRMAATEYSNTFRRVLEEIRDRFPRTLVSVVEMFNVSAIYRATENKAYCKDVHRLIFLECDCAFKGSESASEPYRQLMDELAQEYNKEMRNVIRDLSKVKNDTFAIALHTFTRDLNITSFPLEMISVSCTVSTRPYSTRRLLTALLIPTCLTSFYK